MNVEGRVDDRTPNSEDFARLLLDAAGEGFYAVDMEGRCTFANRESLRLLGYDDEAELLGRNMHALAHHTRPDGTPYLQEECQIYRAHREGRAVISDDEVLFRKDGTSFPVEIRAFPVDGGGRVEGAVFTFVDITERRRVQAELDQNRALQRLAGSVARLGGWSLDVAANQVIWSEEIFEILDYPKDAEVVVEEALEQFLPEDRVLLVTALEACAESGTPFELELRLETRLGRRLWARVIGEARHGPDGRVSHVTGAHQDITAQKEAESQIRLLAERLTTTLESITDGFFTLDRDWRFTYVNRRAEELMQRDRNSLLGRSFWDEYAAGLDAEAESAYRRAMTHNITMVPPKFYYAPLNGWFQVKIYPSGQGLAVYFQDVTEQHRTQLALARQAELLDQARDAIIVRDIDHRITYWNHGAERLYGYPAEEALGQSIRELLYRDPDTFDRATDAVFADDEWVGELVHIAQSGDELTVEGRWSLVLDDHGRPESVLAINSDVTDRRRAEQQLLRAQRLDSLGTLAGGIAHDLNNVLAPITLAAQMLKKPGADAATREMLEIIEQSTARGGEMIRQVLSFASGVDGDKLEFDLNKLLDDVAQIVRTTFPKNVHVLRVDSTEAWPAQGDPTQLHQVLMNLCINARDAMPDGGTLRLSIDAITVDDHYTARDQDVTPGQYVRIRVEDDGTGIDQSTMDRLFEPFFTTKPQGKGTGLGLSTARGIVRSHGGFFQVDSQPGAGSAFDVHLPLADQPAADARPDDDKVRLPRGNGEVVLLVDDEANVRRATRRTLEAAGYGVIDASDGTEAVSLFTRRADDIAAVIIDMMMPGMDGPTTIQVLLGHRPRLPVIAVTGLIVSREVATAATLGVDHVLAKPFTPATLLTTLHALLKR